MSTVEHFDELMESLLSREKSLVELLAENERRAKDQSQTAHYREVYLNDLPRLSGKISGLRLAIFWADFHRNNAIADSRESR